MNLHSAAAASVFVLAGAAPAFAGTIGPDAFEHYASDEPIAFVDVSGTGTAVLDGADDAATGAIALGFTFRFYGTDYSSLFISSNGLLTFVSANTQFSNANLTTTAPSVDVPTIAVYWDDIVTNGADDKIYYQTLGSPGSRQFVAQWNQVSHINDSASGNTYTFEAILYEGTNSILFQYLDTTTSSGALNDGSSATIGIRNTGGQSNGNNLQWGFNTNGSVTSGTAILFVVNPEPGTLALFGLGAAGLALGVRRRHRNAAVRRAQG